MDYTLLYKKTRKALAPSPTACLLNEATCKYLRAIIAYRPQALQRRPGLKLALFLFVLFEQLISK